MGALSSIFNFVVAQKQNHFNAQQAAESRRFSEHMWDKNNAYNSPANQKSLLQQAGLNPNMIYSQGGIDASAQLQTASPQASSAGLPTADFNPLSTVGDLQSLNLQSIEIEKQKLVKEQEQENLNILKQTLSGMRADNAAKRMQNYMTWVKKYLTEGTFHEFMDWQDSTDYDPDTGLPTPQTRYSMDDDESVRIRQNTFSVFQSIYKSWQAEGVSVDEATTRIEEIRKSIQYMQKQMEAMAAEADASEALTSVMKKLPDNIAGDFLRVLVYMFSNANISLSGSKK